MSEQSEEKVILCFRDCGTRIKFDEARKSQSGKKIPIDYATNEPHKCPKSTFGKDGYVPSRGASADPAQSNFQTIALEQRVASLELTVQELKDKMSEVF